MKKPSRVLIKLFDISFSLLLLTTFFIPLVILILIKLIVDGRPLCFNSNRIGQNGNLFTVYKFRTMVNNRAVITTYLDSINSFGFEKIPRDAPIYTKMGCFFEKYQIVELLQLFNVLQGNMSLIGYRPLPELRFKQLEQEVGKEKLAQRHNVLPGITGLSQIVGKSKLSNSERVEIEIYYNKFLTNNGQSKILRYNILILLETLIQIVLRRDFLMIFKKEKVVNSIFIDDKKIINEIVKASFTNARRYSA